MTDFAPTATGGKDKEGGITITLPKDRYDDLVRAEEAMRAGGVRLYERSIYIGYHGVEQSVSRVEYVGEDEVMRTVVEFAASHMEGRLAPSVPAQVAALEAELAKESASVAVLQAHIREQRHIIDRFNRSALFREVKVLESPLAQAKP